MRQTRDRLGAFALASMLAACGSSSGGTSSGHGGEGGSKGAGGGATGGAGGSVPVCTDGGGGGTGVPHVVIIVQENHTFDTYFGTWCTAAPGSNPTCTAGVSCCEAAPAMDPGGASPIVLDDTSNAAFDPNHEQACELGEIDMGAMDKFVTGTSCSDPRNFAIASAATVKPYRDLAAQYAIADRYFQPIAGQSSSNDMYLAVAHEVFVDNAYEPMTLGDQCSLTMGRMDFTGKTIADLLKSAGKTVNWYAEGYALMKSAGTSCPTTPTACKFGLPVYPCVYDPSDVPFNYYAQFDDASGFMRDYTQLAKDLAEGTLPDVAYVKGYGFHSEHPGYRTTISAGTTFVTSVFQAIQASCYKDTTLVLLTWDEGGGFFDHVSPPPESTVDNQPYGMRVPLLAMGRFAQKGTVSHVTMEHSSIVKFLEWNYLGGKTGQLQARDAVVNNIGSLLDPTEVGATIPDQ
jgi:phospholipase C